LAKLAEEVAVLRVNIGVLKLQVERLTIEIQELRKQGSLGLKRA